MLKETSHQHGKYLAIIKKSSFSKYVQHYLFCFDVLAYSTFSPIHQPGKLINNERTQNTLLAHKDLYRNLLFPSMECKNLKVGTKPTAQIQIIFSRANRTKILINFKDEWGNHLKLVTIQKSADLSLFCLVYAHLHQNFLSFKWLAFLKTQTYLYKLLYRWK